MKIWAVIDVTHLEVVKVFGSEESADIYATYENMKSDEDRFIHKGFEVDERMDDIYEFTSDDLFDLESTTPPIYSSDAYPKSKSIRCAFERKIAWVMVSQISRVYCIIKTIGYCSAIDFYRSERIADRESRIFMQRHQETEHPKATIQLHGYFVED